MTGNQILFLLQGTDDS